jgi:hypothetical protein
MMGSRWVVIGGELAPWATRAVWPWDVAPAPHFSIRGDEHIAVTASHTHRCHSRQKSACFRRGLGGHETRME